MNDSTVFLKHPYQWQESQWQHLIKMLNQDKLPHALLFEGIEGTGKLDFAQAFANRLICDSPENNFACGQCKRCQLLMAGSHPDFKMLSPEEKSKIIKVDQVRGMVDFVNKTSQFSGFKVIIINPAEAMNISSSNALLKSLEEPGEKTVFLLVCHRPSSLMATIRSRCQKIVFPQPNENISNNWLEKRGVSDSKALLSVAGGAPLKALSLENSTVLVQRQEMLEALLKLRKQEIDPVVVARQWEKNSSIESLHWLISWTLDWVRVKNSQPLNSHDQQAVLVDIASSLNQASIFTFWDTLKEALQQVQSNSNPNINLMWDDLLIKWVHLD